MNDLLKTRSTWLSASIVSKELCLSKSSVYAMMAAGAFGDVCRLSDHKGGSLRVRADAVRRFLADRLAKTSLEFGFPLNSSNASDANSKYPAYSGIMDAVDRVPILAAKMKIVATLLAKFDDEAPVGEISTLLDGLDFINAEIDRLTAICEQRSKN